MKCNCGEEMEKVTRASGLKLPIKYICVHCGHSTEVEEEKRDQDIPGKETR